MECPNCKNSFTYSIQMYLKNHSGEFTCPSCKSRLTLHVKNAYYNFICILIACFIYLYCVDILAIKYDISKIMAGMFSFLVFLPILLSLDYLADRNKNPAKLD